MLKEVWNMIKEGLAGAKIVIGEQEWGFICGIVTGAVLFVTVYKLLH